MDRERSEMRRRAAAMAEASSSGVVDVWPGLAPHVDRVMTMTEPGLILVRGDMMSGRSTLARAWVERSIRQGIPAAVVEADRLCRLEAGEYAAQADGWHAVPRLAIDGLGQSEAAMRPWQADRFSALLSARHRLLTLVTVPLEVEAKGGGDWLAGRLGVELARRALTMAKLSKQGVRLVAAEVLGE